MIYRDTETGFDWYIDDIKSDVNSDPVLDPGTGPKRVVRTFIIQADPSQDIKKEDVLNFHRKSLQEHIIKSGLTLDRELTISKGNKKSEFVIFAVCKMASNVINTPEVLNRKPKLAQNLLKHKKKSI